MGIAKATTNQNKVSIGFLFNYIANDWQKQINAVLHQSTLDHHQYALLNALQNHQAHNSIANQVMLSNDTGIDKMTTSKLMRVLEQKKLIKRKESKLDSRAKTVEITERGARLHSETTAIIDDFESTFFNAIISKDKNFGHKLEQLL